MPYYPTVQETRAYQQATEAFRGYNHNFTIADGEFYDMQNLTSAYFPVLSPRGKRGVYASPDSAQALIDKDALCYVDGADFVVNQHHVQMGLSTVEADCPKTLISMGAYVIIMPDKMYINTKDLSDYGAIEAVKTTTTNISFQLCTVDGSLYENVVTSTTPPAEPANMSYWLDTSSTPHALKQWSATSAMWITIATTYIKITAAGIGLPFEQYDGVTISGVVSPALSFLNNSTTIVWDKGDDYLVVTGIIDAAVAQESQFPLTISRLMPYMDFITEANNRLWGCRYGTARNGEVVNEIYACKLGDFRNWNCFMGISTDSYAVSCGTDGQFTGAVTHLGYPIFFKENFLHKIYGNYPSNYQVQSTACRGVQKGCDKSLAIVNEILYYKSRSAVCAYDGSLPVEISKELGEEIYSDAVAGACGNKYYISMKDSADNWHLFVYDTLKAMWHHEDNTQVSAFCASHGEMYFINTSDGKIKTMLGSGTLDADPVHWEAETGVIGIVDDANYPSRLQSHRYISRVVTRMSLEKGAKVSFYIQYDSTGIWKHLTTIRGTTFKSFPVPIKPKRCDHFRLRIVGDGDAKIYSIVKSIEWGSDLP